MSYFKPYIDESGFHYPTYNEILEQLVDDMQTIFGSGIYLGSDSQDYQMLSKFAEKIYDSYQTCEIVYLSRSPVTSIGAGLDYIVAINGIARKQGTKSTVTVTLEGTAGTVIYDGAVADTNGHVWDLPATVIIGDEGSVNRDLVGILYRASRKIRVKRGEFFNRRLCLLVTDKRIGEQLAWVLGVLLGPWQEHLTLYQHKLGRHYDKLRRNLHIKPLRLVYVFHILVAD